MIGVYFILLVSVRDVCECNSGGWLRLICSIFFFQAEDGIRDLVRSRGLGDVYKRQIEFERRVLRRRPDQRHHAPLHRGEEGVLLRAVEALSLIHI